MSLKKGIGSGNIFTFADMNLSIIIPAYNEENYLNIVMDALDEVQFPKYVNTVEYVVVDDCSSDTTPSVIQQLAAKNTRIRAFRHEVNQGKGAAVRTGFQKASGDVMLIQDADLELSPKDIPAMLDAMHELGVDFINGSRYMPGVIRPLHAFSRYFFNRLFTLFTSLILNVKLTDMACGYKLIRRELLDKISLRENRFGFECELIIKAMRYKKTIIAEVPVHYFPRNQGEGKKLSNLDGLKIFWCIIKYGLLKYA